MTQPAVAQEPSMEEILASIRRIIADDDPAKAVASAPPAPKIAEPPPPKLAVAPPPAPPEPERATEEIESMLAQAALPPAPEPIDEPASDILDLTEQMTAPEEVPAFRTIDGQSDLIFAEPAPEPLPPPPPRRPAVDERGLVSAATSAAVDSAFNTLAHTVLVQNARTLEDLVREMLRPMLKSWLDDNLPGMVERLVRAEIERVSRGRA
ncbi:MAG: DUF2497 domain-containing protein [Hyphomicrobiales bacterium]|nr:DUF2497 domain-containing protein [Hyphomicrobiales bacterium]